MSASAYVEHAALMANEMVRRECRGPGDMDNAMRRLSRRYGIPHGTFWSLRYKKPRDMFVSAFAKLSEAYEAECQRQRKAIEHDIAVAKAKGGLAEALAIASARVAGDLDAGE